MGKTKKNKKNDTEKKAQLQARKDAKQDKATRKRENKLSAELAVINGEDLNDDGNNNGSMSIDELLVSYTEQDKSNISAVVEDIGEAPSPRANFSITVIPSSGGSNTTEFILYGGEHFNGVENVVYDDMFKCTVLLSASSAPSTSWKRITVPHPRPAARCSHQTVLYRDALYVLGGELATADQFHHYKDFWRFDLKTNTWNEMGGNSSSRKPTISPRSGHRCVVWRSYMLCFGGFYEALRETRWYNDLHIFNFATEQWLQIPYSKLASIPPPRSAFCFAVDPATDTAFVYGGFSKLKHTSPGIKAEGKIHTDKWALNLKPLPHLVDQLGNGKVPAWDRLSKKGNTPSQRSGMSYSVHKGRMVCYGGVQDNEGDNHKMDSIFYDEIFTFDMTRRRWYKLDMKKAAVKSKRRKQKVEEAKDESNDEYLEDDLSDDELESTDLDGPQSGWDLDKLRSNMFAFVDGSGNIIYEKIEDEDKDDGYNADRDTNINTHKYEEKENEPSDVISDMITDNFAESVTISSPTKTETVSKSGVNKSEVMHISTSGAPQAVTRDAPLPRINAGVFVERNNLFIYGGLLEVGDREITLDDFWLLDLSKREQWECIQSGTMYKQVWKGIESDNDSSYVSGEGTNEPDESDSEDDECPILLESTIVEEKESESGDDGSSKSIKKDKKKLKKIKNKSHGIRSEIARLKEHLDLDDVNRTPELGEDLAQFYLRTTAYWNNEAIKKPQQNNDQPLSEKELRREGFALARERFEELSPVLDRLNELDNEQQESERKKKDKKTEKKLEKKQHKSRRQK